MQNHRFHSLLLAPVHCHLQQSARQTLPSVIRLCVHIQNIPAPLSSPNHVRRPVHQPQSCSRHYRLRRRDREPRQIFPRLHLPSQPRSKSFTHRPEGLLVPAPHIKKHRSTVMHDCFQILLIQSRRPYLDFPDVHWRNLSYHFSRLNRCRVVPHATLKRTLSTPPKRHQPLAAAESNLCVPRALPGRKDRDLVCAGLQFMDSRR